MAIHWKLDKVFFLISQIIWLIDKLTENFLVVICASLYAEVILRVGERGISYYRN